MTPELWSLIHADAERRGYRFEETVQETTAGTVVEVQMIRPDGTVAMIARKTLAAVYPHGV